jgi:hypothetical protein
MRTINADEYRAALSRMMMRDVQRGSLLFRAKLTGEKDIRFRIIRKAMRA